MGDVPGALAKLSGLIAQYHTNILHIIHERTAKDIPIKFSKVILVLETRGSDYVREIERGLNQRGDILSKY